MSFFGETLRGSCFWLSTIELLVRQFQRCSFWTGQACNSKWLQCGSKNHLLMLALWNAACLVKIRFAKCLLYSLTNFELHVLILLKEPPTTTTNLLVCFILYIYFHAENVLKEVESVRTLQPQGIPSCWSITTIVTNCWHSFINVSEANLWVKHPCKGRVSDVYSCVKQWCRKN